MVSLAAEAQRQLPLRKLAVFARKYTNGDIVSQLPLYSYADLTLSMAHSGSQAWKHECHLPLGQLATDQVGYASFDLSLIADLQTLIPLVANAPQGESPADLDVSLRLWVAPFGDEYLAFEALDVGQNNGEVVVVRYEITDDDLAGRTLGPPLASMQDPGIDDWRLSPTSFATATARLVGEEGCDELYPANIATHQYKFRQLVRVVEDGARKAIDHPVISGIRYGYQLEYQNDWFPIGHSLGRVLYSLPLAPGEQVNLAIIDWSRSDDAARTEATGLTEQLTHDQSRDRLITETVHATVFEHQSGSSSMFGLSLSALVPVDGAILGGSLGLGHASSSSRGSRGVSGRTTQDLADGFHQSSSALRQLCSTVVNQAGQEETGRFETRTVANHNHCHTLTILYYEVLQHHRVVTRYVRRQPVLFLDYSRPAKATFDQLANEAFVLTHRRALERALLDRRHLVGFTALVRKRVAEKALQDALTRWNSVRTRLKGWVFRKFVVMIATGNDGTDNNVYLNVSLTDGRQLRCRQIEPTNTHTGADYYFGSSHDDFSSNELDTYVVAPDQPVRWNDIRGFTVGLALSGIGVGDNWRLARMRIIGLSDDGTTGLLLDKAFDHEFFPGDLHPEVPASPPPISDEDPEPVLTDFIATGTLVLAELLMDHLHAFKDHYQAALLTDSDPVTRWTALADARLATYAVTDLIDNTVLGSVGYEIAYPLTPAADFAARKILGLDDDVDAAAGVVAAEGLVGLPTRGVFAESKLGRCSACEHKDDTRYWDWQTSPIPETAPQIGTVDTGSRYQRPDALTPSAFPAPIVGIATPSPAPDPVAMANALQLLGKGDVFRDMSGMAQLGPFLSSMSQNTMQAVSALSGNQRQNQLADKILSAEGLSGEQKTNLLGTLLGSSSGDGHQGPDHPESSPKSEAEPSSSSEEPPQAPSTTSGTDSSAAAKPQRPRRQLGNFISIRMVGMQGEQYRFVIRRLVINSSGEESFSESSDAFHDKERVSDRNNRVVVGDKRIPRKGSLTLDVDYLPAKVYPDPYSEPAEYWWFVTDASVGYEIRDGSPGINLTIQPQVEIHTITAGSEVIAQHASEDGRTHHFAGGGGVTFNIKVVKVNPKGGYDYTTEHKETKSDTDERSGSDEYHVYEQIDEVKWYSKDGVVVSQP